MNIDIHIVKDCLFAKELTSELITCPVELGKEVDKENKAPNLLMSFIETKEE